MSEQIHFSRQFDLQIWKIHYTSNRLIVELRDPDFRELKLVLLSLPGLEILAETGKETLNWWDNVVHVHENLVAISTYKDPKFPETKGVKVLDLLSGKYIWENKNWQILEGKGSTLLVVRDIQKPLEITEINISTGTVEGFSMKYPENELLLPEMYVAGEGYFNQVSEFLSVKGYEPAKAVEYMDFRALILVGFYAETKEAEQEGIESYILLFNENGELLNRFTCGEKSQGIGMGLFFVVKDQLVFVRDKKEIVILELSQYNKR